MLTTVAAIEQRRSIRKYTTEDIPDEQIDALLEAARLAPSGSNAQPWRFKIVKDGDQKSALAEAACGQMFICRAPVVVVCCADIQRYLSGTKTGAQRLEKTGSINKKIARILQHRTKRLEKTSRNALGARVSLHVAIAIEHMVLRALDFGLGSCWIRLFDEKKVRELFGWEENLYVVALLPLGYPAESPKPRNLLNMKEILID